MSRRDSNPLYKITVLGDGGVGKTALTIQFCLNHFVETYDPTIVDSYRKQITIDDQLSVLEVLDTAGQEEYTSLRDQWIRDGEGFVLVYSITSPSSFARIEFYHAQIQRVKEDEPFFCVLVGNKSDCEPSERQVSFEKGEALAKKLNMPFFESSAKLNINIEPAFARCAKACKVIREVSKTGGSGAAVAGTAGADGKTVSDSAAGAAVTSAAAAAPKETAPAAHPQKESSPADKSKTNKKKKEKCVIC